MTKNKLLPEKIIMMKICGYTYLIIIQDFMETQDKFQDVESP